MLKKYYLKKTDIRKKRGRLKEAIIKLSGIGFSILGLSIITFFTLPLLIWHLIFNSVFAQVISPVPPPFILTPEIIHAIQKEKTMNSLNKLNKKKNNDADTWLYNYKLPAYKNSEIESYYISIPRLDIEKAKVAVKDTDLTKSLVQHIGTPLPPLKGNSVIFGHSTLPQLYNANNYNSIFTFAQNLKPDDLITVHIGSENYEYKVIRTFITEPDDLSVLQQEISDSYLTLITCTPPGTTWKRLIIKARLTNN